jgi:hypothetical protein
MWEFVEFRQLRAMGNRAQGASVGLTLPPEVKKIGADGGKFVAVYVDKEHKAVLLKLVDIEPPEIKLEVPE